MIRALETTYKGWRMRSRLEARWAVFFDALGIVWEYEPQGFQLSDGTCYLPDFWPPTFDGGVYVEVKPRGDPFVKARLFAAEADAAIWLAGGAPEYQVYTILRGADDAYPGVPNVDSAEGENRMFVFPGYEDEDGTIPDEYRYEPLIGAIKAARSARFDVHQ